MFNGEAVLGVVLARGGSKRLPGKNTRLLGERPLISWSIEAGEKSEKIDEVVVSTDSQEIHDVSIECGAKRVVKRPSALATDDAKSADVAIHALKALQTPSRKFGYVALLQPTSPLRTGKHIDLGFDLFAKVGATAVIGVCETEKPIDWMGKLGVDLNMTEMSKKVTEPQENSSQLLNCQVNGAIYIISASALLKERTFFPKNGSYAFLMDRRSSVDIDNEEEFQIASMFMQERMRKGVDE